MEQKKAKKGTPPPRYDEGFKAGAVRMVTEQGRQPTEVAKGLGICIDTLRSWLKASGIQMGQASRLNREQQRMRYTHYHGLAQVSNWVRLKFAAMNLKKLARWKTRIRFAHSSSTATPYILSLINFAVCLLRKPDRPLFDKL